MSSEFWVGFFIGIILWELWFNDSNKKSKVFKNPPPITPRPTVRPPASKPRGDINEK